MDNFKPCVLLLALGLLFVLVNCDKGVEIEDNEFAEFEDTIAPADPEGNAPDG